jgi:hypothetical protein
VAESFQGCGPQRLHSAAVADVGDWQAFAPGAATATDDTILRFSFPALERRRVIAARGAFAPPVDQDA